MKHISWFLVFTIVMIILFTWLSAVVVVFMQGSLSSNNICVVLEGTAIFIAGSTMGWVVRGALKKKINYE